jgi:hypothetical protein
MSCVGRASTVAAAVSAVAAHIMHKCCAMGARYSWRLRAGHRQPLPSSDAGLVLGAPRNQLTTDEAAGRMPSKTVGWPVALRQSYKRRLTATPAVTIAVAAQTHATSGERTAGCPGGSCVPEWWGCFTPAHLAPSAMYVQSFAGDSGAEARPRGLGHRTGLRGTLRRR